MTTGEAGSFHNAKILLLVVSIVAVVVAAAAGLALWGLIAFAAAPSNRGLSTYAPLAVAADASEIYGCDNRESAHRGPVSRWNGQEFETVTSPTTELVEACEARLAEQQSSLSPEILWEITRGDVKRSTNGGTDWTHVTFDPDFGFRAYFARSGPEDEVAISFCREEARNPGYYCYVEISNDGGQSWQSLPTVGVTVKSISAHGVVTSPSLPNATVSYRFLDYDGNLLTTIEDPPANPDIHVLNDRIILIDRPNSMTLRLEEHTYP